MDNKEKELLKKIKELHSHIQNDSKQSLNRALKLGSILQTQKERVKHGNFINWVNNFLPFSERTSRNYLTLHKNKEKIKEAKVKSLSEAYQLLKTTRPFALYKNDYDRPAKNSTVYTPPKVSEYIHTLLSSIISPTVILDPAIGKGSLTKLFHKSGSKIIGVDIDPVGKNHSDIFIHNKFEDIEKWEHDKPQLIIANPPFNGKRPILYPELFLRHITKLFGEKVKVVLFVPIGFRLNVKLTSKRWKWLVNSKLRITSIIYLPINIFEAKFHSEILCFNIPKLKPHYFLYE